MLACSGQPPSADASIWRAASPTLPLELELVPPELLLVPLLDPPFELEVPELDGLPPLPDPLELVLPLSSSPGVMTPLLPLLQAAPTTSAPSADAFNKRRALRDPRRVMLLSPDS
jgi:hypothetical protein